MCLSAFLKVTLYLLSVVIFFLGIGVLGMGAKVIVDSGPLLAVLKNVDNYSQLLQLVNISYMLIVAGPVLLVTAFLGCYGYSMERRGFLLMHSLSMLIVFLVTFVGATVLLVHQDSILNSKGDEVLKNFRQGYGEDESLTSLWNNTMVELKCCGFNNYKDFDGSPFDVVHGGDVYPPMCCSSTFTGVCSELKARVSHLDGCYDKLLQEIKSETGLTATMALLTGAFELAAMVVSMILYCKGRKIFQR